MSEFTISLPPELADIGLMALADPGLAERLVEALREQPADGPADPLPQVAQASAA
jgi:hypothetical protein